MYTKGINISPPHSNIHTYHTAFMYKIKYLKPISVVKYYRVKHHVYPPTRIYHAIVR